MSEIARLPLAQVETVVNVDALRALIERPCGVRLAVRTMGTYLARWGFTAQKTPRRAYEQSPAAVRRSLQGLPGYRGPGPAGARPDLLGRRDAVALG